MADRNRDWERAKEEIRGRVDLVEIISRHTQLKKAGRDRWKGLCPFHGEKTPSFSVDPVRGYYHCFGCKASGDVFTFVQQKEKMTFPEAMRMLAERAGVELPQYSGDAGASKARSSERQEQSNLLERTAVYYRNLLLKDTRADAARAYAERRGLTGEIAETFRVGFAPRNRQTLVTQLRSLKIDPKIALGAGLVVPVDDEEPADGNWSWDHLRDRFIDRLMFTIEDDRGKVVGFGGRALGDAQAKYLNSPATDLFQKGLILYNFHRAKEFIDASAGAVVVEGYMDAIAFWRAGIKNVVAPLGTALTAEQAQKLVRLTQKIYLCFDADEAGERAAARALDVLLPLGVSPLRIVVPSGKDPDDLLASEGPEALRRLLDSAEPMLERLISSVAARAGSNLAERQSAVGQLLPVFTLVRDPTLRSEMLRHAALAFGFPEKAIEETVSRASARHRIYRQPVSPPELPASEEKKLAVPSAVRAILWIFMNHADLRRPILESSMAGYLKGRDRELFDSLVKLWEETGGCEPKAWFGRLDESGLVEAAVQSIASEEPRLRELKAEDCQRLLRDIGAAFERERLKSERAALRTKLAELEKSSGASAEIDRISLELIALDHRIKQTIAVAVSSFAVSAVAESQTGFTPPATATPAPEDDPADDYYGDEDVPDAGESGGQPF